MKLCGHSVSPFVERVLIAMDMKGVPDAIALSDVPGGFKSEEHIGFHPLGKIPFLLLDDGRCMTESQSIVEYLDATAGGDPLTPNDPFEAAKVNRIVRVMDIYYSNAIGPMGRMAFGGSATEEELADAKDRALPEAMRYLDACLEGEDFAVGNGWTAADATIMSHLYWFERLMPQFGAVDLSLYPKVHAYWQKAQTTDIYKASKVRADKSVEKFFASMK